jgi:hypothetical protein
LDAGRQQIIGEVIMHSDVAWGWSQVQCIYHLILVSLYVAHLEFVGEVSMDGVASCKDVSGCSERKFALHEIFLQF